MQNDAESGGEGVWEDFGTGFGVWRFHLTANAFGSVEILVHSTADRDGPTNAQRNSLRMLRELPASVHDDIAAILADSFGEPADEIDFSCDLTEIPLLDKSPISYAYLEGEASPDAEHRVTLLLRDGKVMGLIDRDATGEISEWDAIDEIEALLEEDDDE